MKKVRLSLVISGLFLFAACNSNNDGSGRQTVSSDSTTADRPVSGTAEPSAPLVPAAGDKESAATAELCTCLKPFFADMSPQVRAILVKAGESSTPMETLTSELQQVKGGDEQERLFREMEKFETDFQLQRCSESIKKKYNLDENDMASRDKVLKAAGEIKECEVVYALMKIGVEQEKRAGAVQK